MTAKDLDLERLAKMCPEIVRKTFNKQVCLYAGVYNKIDVELIARRLLDMAKKLERFAIKALWYGEIRIEEICEILQISDNDYFAIMKKITTGPASPGWSVNDFKAELARLRKEP